MYSPLCGEYMDDYVEITPGFTVVNAPQLMSAVMMTQTRINFCWNQAELLVRDV